MNDLGRYRKLYVRLWHHPGFVSLSDSEKVLAVYVLTGPQSNRLGLYVFSIGKASEELGTVPETLSKRLLRVCETLEWRFDPRARVIYIPSFFRWNPPENQNVLKGSLKDLNEIPQCALIEAFAGNAETLPETLRQTFREQLTERFPNGYPNQEQEQEQEQEQDPARRNPSARRAGAAPIVKSAALIPDLDGPSAKANGNGLKESFETFWALYPKKTGKKAAWRAWQKRKPGHELAAEMLAALEWQCTQDNWLREAGRFVPNPATWINDGREQDEPTNIPHLSGRTIAIVRASEEFLKP